MGSGLPKIINFSTWVFVFGEFEGRSPSRTSGGGGLGGGGRSPPPPRAPEAQACGAGGLWGWWNKCRKPEKQVSKVENWSKNVKKWSNRVLVGRFGPRVCENGAYGFWEAYGTPPGAQNGHKKIKNSEKYKKSEIPENSLFSRPIFPGRRHGRSLLIL